MRDLGAVCDVEDGGWRGGGGGGGEWDMRYKRTCVGDVGKVGGFRPIGGVGSRNVKMLKYGDVVVTVADIFFNYLVLLLFCH